MWIAKMKARRATVALERSRGVRGSARTRADGRVARCKLTARRSTRRRPGQVAVLRRRKQASRSSSVRHADRASSTAAVWFALEISPVGQSCTAFERRTSSCRGGARNAPEQRWSSMVSLARSWTHETLNLLWC